LLLQCTFGRGCARVPQPWPELPAQPSTGLPMSGLRSQVRSVRCHNSVHHGSGTRECSRLLERLRRRLPPRQAGWRETAGHGLRDERLIGARRISGEGRHDGHRLPRRRGSSSTIIQIFGAYGHVARGCYLPGLFTCLGSGPLKDSLEWTSSLDDHPSSRPKKDGAERASCEGPRRSEFPGLKAQECRNTRL
jgi:hypothetical protein